MTKTLEMTIVSDSGRLKAEIERRAEGVLQVTVYQLIEERVDGYGGEVWVPMSKRATFTDTLENAEKLAREQFQLFEVA